MPWGNKVKEGDKKILSVELEISNSTLKICLHFKKRARRDSNPRHRGP